MRFSCHSAVSWHSEILLDWTFEIQYFPRINCLGDISIYYDEGGSVEELRLNAANFKERTIEKGGSPGFYSMQWTMIASCR